MAVRSAATTGGPPAGEGGIAAAASEEEAPDAVTGVAGRTASISASAKLRGGR